MRLALIVFAGELVFSYFVLMSKDEDQNESHLSMPKQPCSLHNLIDSIYRSTQLSECTFSLCILLNSIRYPKIQGPNQELWTLGGPVRTLKLNGSKKFSLWSWVVSQQEGAPSKTMNAEIPAKDVVMPDRRLLSTSDRRALFEKKYLSMTNTTSKKTFQSPLHSDEGSTGLMTPPSSPDSDTQHTAVVIGEGPVPDLQAETTKPSHISLRMQALRRTVDIGSRTGRPWVMPSYSFIHPYCTSQSNTSKTSSPNSTEDLLINDDLSSVSTLETIQLSPSSSSPRVLPYSREISRMDGADLDGSISFLEFMRECAEQNDATSLSDLEMPSLTPLITGSSAICPGKCGDDNCLGLCDIDTTKCRYSEIFPTKHYHSPPDKCRCLPEMPHEHCISQTRALPGPAGNCLLLASLRTPDHVCCIWSAADRESWPPLGREYDRRKLEEARLYRANLYDLGRKVKSNPSVGQMPPRLVLREDLDEAGKMLLDDC